MEFKVRTHNFLTRRNFLLLGLLMFISISSISFASGDFSAEDGNEFTFEVGMTNVGVTDNEMFTFGLHSDDEIDFKINSLSDATYEASWGNNSEFSLTDILIDAYPIDESKLSSLGGFYLYDSTFDYLENSDLTVRGFVPSGFVNITKRIDHVFSFNQKGYNFVSEMKFNESYFNNRGILVGSLVYLLDFTWDENNLLQQLKVDLVFDSEIQVLKFAQLSGELRMLISRVSANSVALPFFGLNLYFISSDSSNVLALEIVLLVIYFLILALLISTVIAPYEPVVNGLNNASKPFKPLLQKIDSVLKKVYTNKIMTLISSILAPVLIFFVWTGGFVPTIQQGSNDSGLGYEPGDLAFRDLFIVFLILQFTLFLYYRLENIEWVTRKKIITYGLFLGFTGIIRSILWYYGSFNNPPLPNRIYDLLGNIFFILYFGAIANAFNNKLLFEEEGRASRVYTTKGYSYLAFFPIFVFIPNTFLIYLNLNFFLSDFLTLFAFTLGLAYTLVAITFFQMIYISITFLKIRNHLKVVISEEEALKYPINIYEIPIDTEE